MLDLVFVDRPALVVDSGVTLPIAGSDHHGIYCVLKVMSKRTSSFVRKICNYSNGNYICLREALSYAPWTAGIDLYDDNLDGLVAYYYSIFMSAIDEFIPNRHIKVRPSDKEWMTSYIRHLINRRDTLYWRYKTNKIP